MNIKTMDIFAILVTLLSILGATVLPLFYESFRGHNGAEVITLTAVAEEGAFTLEDVSGKNYWYRPFLPARPILRVGRTVVLRLKSADVVHTFYCPELDIGPVEIHPGHPVEVQVTPGREGAFEYYCTTICGDGHFGMRGEIVVQGNGGPPQPASSSGKGRYGQFWREAPPPYGARPAQFGRWLFHKNGCFTCHGSEGKGGVPNPNYVRGTIPSLHTLAERMMLPKKKDADKIVALIEDGTHIEEISDPPVPRFTVVLSQYRAVKNIILNGSTPGKKDPHGPEPPLAMPSWSERLSDEDIDAIIAYLLTLQPWEKGL